MRRVLLLGVLFVLAVPASAARLPILASHDWWPVWSPDAQSIAFTRLNGQGTAFALEVVPAGGGRVVQLAQARSQLLPSWSPDSRRLAYQSGGRIYTIARDGSGRRSVAAGLFPAWSPDGSIVAYVRDGAIRVGPASLAAHVISRPAWSPDGTELAFATSDGIHVVGRDGVERLVTNTVGEPSAPVFSYDGVRLAYTAGSSLYVVAADGASAPVRVAGKFVSLGSPSWAPTGDALVYTADGAVRTTWLGTHPRTATGAPAEVGAAFSPGDLNGHRVAASLPIPRCPGHSGIDAGLMLSGTCAVVGTPGPDVIEGTQSWGDVILAGAGNDKIHAGDRHTDRIDCGPGRDEVWADRLDKLAHCEVVHRELANLSGMAVTTAATLDANQLRADFAVFDELVNGRPVAYLDSASSTQKPRQVLDAMREFYEHSYANVHRGVYTLAERATAGYEGAREKVRAFINAPSSREVIFTRSATEALNLVAYAWGLDNLGPGDVVVITELEHHANFVPWQFIAKKTGAEFAHIPIDDLGELQLDVLDEIASRGNVKVVANNLVSNTLGTINPVEKLAAWAHEQGAIMVVDAAQAAPHRELDVQALGCDFLAFSSHKLCGPSGAGALWGRRELLEEMQPFNFGGEMIRSVSLERTSWNELPYKFEAGTPAIAEAYGFGQAVEYISAIGLQAIEAHEHALVVQTMDALAEIPGIRIFGPPADRRTGIVSFELENVHPHDVAQILNWEGVAVRAGHHCTQPLMTRLGVAATTRASFYLYSLPEDVDRLVAGLHKVKETFGV